MVVQKYYEKVPQHCSDNKQESMSPMYVAAVDGLSEIENWWTNSPIKIENDLLLQSYAIKIIDSANFVINIRECTIHMSTLEKQGKYIITSTTKIIC